MIQTVNITKVIALAALSIILSVSVVFGQDPCVEGMTHNYDDQVQGLVKQGGDIAGTMNIDYGIYEDDGVTGDYFFMINSISTAPGYLANNKEDVLQQAIIEIIKNEIGTNITPPEDIWVTIPSCWYVDGITEDLKPCSTQYCCKANYFIDYDANGEPYIMSQLLEFDDDNCDFVDPIGGGGEPCDYICEALDFGPEIPVEILPATYECPTCLFDEFIRLTGETFNGEDLEIDFSIYRCDTYIEVVIHSIISSSGGSLGTDKAAILEHATRKVLKHAAMINPGNPDKIILVLISCWGLTPQETAMYPCIVDNYHCCYADYTVTYFPGDDKYKATSLVWGSRYPDDCDNYSCEYVCDDQYIWSDLGSWLKPSIPGFEGEVNLNNFEVRPNPTTGKTEIVIGSLENGDIKIVVYDLLGTEIIKRGYNKSSTNVTYNLDLNSLTDGTYYISVEINGKLAVIQKLMLMK